ncbi:YceI family protein [Dyella choica]|uniref:YceI family protein n=2 Tax=Dyella choica TaxID=1927959 RepID=A0A3S0RXH3_9GAMM|nr:YceI family protein [Dyella choica]
MPALQRYASRHMGLLLLLLFPLLAAASGTEYRIDPASSEAMFHVRLFWLDQVDGQFTHVDGAVSQDPVSDNWVVNATIPVTSVAMPSARMRKRLLAPSFFDAIHHPVIHFTSNPFAQTQLDHGGTLTGYLTLRGVTAPIRFAVAPAHCERPAATPCRIVLRGMLQRSTFGMTSDRLAVSDSVDLNLSITLQPDTR